MADHKSIKPHCWPIKGIRRSCATCGTDFTVRYQSDKRRFCSRICVPAQRVTDVRRQACRANLILAMEANRLRPKRIATFACAACGVQCEVKQSHVLKKRYCSTTCMASAYKTRLVGAENPNYRAAGEKVCAGCGRSFLHYSKSRKYCTFKCYLDASEEMRSKPGCRTDANQAEIMAALRQVGASVLDLSAVGRGVPDLLVSFQGVNYLIEVKNAGSAYGRAGLTKRQQSWADWWKGGPVHIATSIDDALRIIGVLPKESGAIQDCHEQGDRS